MFIPSFELPGGKSFLHFGGKDLDVLIAFFIVFFPAQLSSFESSAENRFYLSSLLWIKAVFGGHFLCFDGSVFGPVAYPDDSVLNKQNSGACADYNSGSKDYEAAEKPKKHFFCAVTFYDVFLGYHNGTPWNGTNN